MSCTTKRMNESLTNLRVTPLRSASRIAGLPVFVYEPSRCQECSCGSAKKPPVNGFLYRSPHTAMTPWFLASSSMQSISFIVG